MSDYKEVNRALWNLWTPHHVTSELYDNTAFIAGECTLDEIDVREVGDVKGKSLLHLQCHFGQDTLSFARRGAKVSGLDISDEGIAAAQNLARQIGQDARFVRSDVYDAPRHFAEPFDIVYTSIGVLAWLGDLKAWAKVIASLLKPSGFFYIREFHPLTQLLDYLSPEAVLKYPYFKGEAPMAFEESGSYAAPDAPFVSKSMEWSHSVSEILEALLSAGLSIDFFREYNYVGYQHLKCLRETSPGKWTFDAVPGGLPLQFSLKAVHR